MNRPALHRWCIAALLAISGAAAPTAPPADRPAPKPVPLTQVVPQPYEQVSFQRDGRELARYHFGPGLRRPFVFPVVGPAGRSLTRMGHPQDPESHSHHNSVWVSHHDVNGVSFWDDRGKGRIVHRRVEKFDDADDAAAVTAVNEWVDEGDDGTAGAGKVILEEHRRTEIRPLEGGEWLLVMDLRLKPKGDQPVTLGKTPFGVVGVRMAKTIGTNDGGGEIRNSEGQVNEPEVFWKKARWVDYSGPIARDVTEGITLMDHPSNPNHPTVFHVRGDGWMGASLTFDGPRAIEPGKPLTLRYGLYVHAGKPGLEQLEARWKEFAKTEPAKLSGD
jgi:hypothetical protein